MKGGGALVPGKCRKTHIRRALCLLLLPVLPACSKEEEASVALAAIQGDYAEGEQPTDERSRAFAPRFKALVREYWGTEAALEAGLWLMQETARETARDARAEVVAEFTDSILLEYAGSPGLAKLGEMASLYTEEQRQRYFGELREDSPYPEVRAAAIYYPARLKMQRLRPMAGLPGMAGGGGPSDPERSRALDSAEADLRQVMEEYGDLPAGSSTYGIMADAILNPHKPEDLAKGKPAPEIVGRTVDGEEMRLSDFRGMVTVIDFWGDW